MIDALPRLPPLAPESVDGPICLLAGPGSGKTETLVRLYEGLVGAGLAKRDEILVLTFSTSAAAELGGRVDLRLRDSYGTAWISTFHSFCRRLLRDHRPGPEPLLLSGFQEWLCMRQVLRDLGPELGSWAPLSESDAFAADALAFISTLKQNLARAEPFGLLVEGSGSERLRKLALVYGAYQERLGHVGAADFRDLILTTVELLQADSVLRQTLQERFRYVLVDEFQDLDPAQFALLQLLAPPAGRPHVVAAGDPDQSIYGFRGSVPELLETFRRTYGARTVELAASWRCPPRVLEAAHQVLASAGGEAPPRMAARADAGSPVVLLEEQDAVEEAFAIAREVKRLLLAGEAAPSQVAILLRSSVSLAAPFEEALRALGLPYEVRGQAALSRNEVVRFLLAYLKLLADPDSPDALTRVLGSTLSGVGPRILGRLSAQAAEEGRPLDKVVYRLLYRLAAYDPERFPLPWGEAVEPVAQAEDWDPDALPLDAAAQVHRAMTVRQRLRWKAGESSLGTLAYAVLIEAGVLSRLLALPLDGDDRGEAMADLRIALDAFGQVDEVWERLHGTPPRLGDLKGELEALVGKAVDEAAPQASRRDAVQILTIHQAKGLEFGVVFLAGFAAGVLPARGRPHPLLAADDQEWLVSQLDGFQPSWPRSQGAHLLEEARLAYVAMSRASSRLYLSYAREYEEAAGPSPLVEAVRDLVIVPAQEAPVGEVLTTVDAETKLALHAPDLPESTVQRARELGLDVDFIRDPQSGQGFQPYLDRPHDVDPHHYSATDLTAYLKCPRLYWYSHHPGLARPAKSPEMERGSFIHRVLEDFHAREDEWRRLPTDAARAWLDQAIASHLEHYLSRIELVLDRQREEQEVRRILRNYAEFATSFQKVRRLGTLSTEKRFVLHLEGAEIHGKIDRINDTGEGTCEVVDYKTGRGASPNQIYNSYFSDELYDVQLAIYYLACRDGADEDGRPLALTPRFLSLWFPKERRYDAPIRQVLFTVGATAGLNQWWERQLTEADLERARSVVLGAVAGILAGDFSPRPREGAPGTCRSFTGCAHQAICPFARTAPE